MMIDWLACRLPFQWGDVPIRDGYVMHVRADGSIDWTADKRLMVEGSFSSRVSIRTVERGFAEFSGNPSKFLQGHNVFGPADGPAMLAETMIRICRSLGREVDPADLAAWRAGNAVLSRVDLTGMLEMPSRADVRAWLQSASDASYVRWRGRGHYNNGTLTFGKVAQGKRASTWQIVMYCKGDEMALPGREPAAALPDRDRLLAWADTKLRIELRLRTQELKRIGRLHVADFRADAVDRVYSEYVDRVQVGDQVTVDVDVLSDLTRGARSAYALWQTGVDIRSVYSRAQFFRWRKVILDATGVDIAVAAPRSNVVPLRRVLVAVPATVPDWAGELLWRPQPLRLVG